MRRATYSVHRRADGDIFLDDTPRNAGVVRSALVYEPGTMLDAVKSGLNGSPDAFYPLCMGGDFEPGAVSLSV